MRTFAPVAGDNRRYTYVRQSGATIQVHVEAFDNAAQTMTVDIDGIDYEWNSGQLVSTAPVGATGHGWTWTPSSLTFPSGDYYIRPLHPAVPQSFPAGQIQFHAEIIEMPVDTMTSVGAVTSVVRGRMNAGYRWNGSACAFTTSFTAVSYTHLTLPTKRIV